MMSNNLRVVMLILSCAGLASAQAAPAAKSSYAVKGKIKGSCVMPQAAPVTLKTTIDGSGKLDPALSSMTWSIPGWYCNGASQITLSAKALRLTSPKTSLTPSQSQTINFTARAVSWAATDATVTTAETTTLGTGALYSGPPKIRNSPRKGPITIRVGSFTVVKGSSSASVKPVSGAYSATITVTLAPNS